MEILKSTIPVLVAIVAAVLAYRFSISSEKRKHQQQNRAQSYIEFLKATAIVGQSQKDGNKEKEFEGLVALTEAKQRVLIYGGDKVVKLLADFHAHGPNISGDNMSRYAKLVLEMRRDSSRKTTTLLSEIETILFESQSRPFAGDDYA
ncbi:MULTISPECIES: hypothetical protein [unclassified Cohnella]|jgi:type II secretory pathway pseudopilin PulG|uniref:hypothetical protein n=1 Tax=unclassified Cohnella TaxID=2636738 RepID=UPI00117CBCA4|nr:MULTISPECIES: hypothetical protein [unclassified Cohnella]